MSKRSITRKQYYEMISSNHGWLDVPRAFFHHFGINEAIFLGQLISLQFKAMTDKHIDENGWFYAKQDYIYNRTSLSKYQQRAAKKVLQERSVIDWKKFGAPPKLFYKIIWYNVKKELQQYDEDIKLTLQEGAKYI